MARRGPSIRQLGRDEGGVTAIVIGLCMTALMGFTALAVDVGVWYADKRAAQGAADSAAYSAAVDYAAGDTATNAIAAAKAIAAQYGLTDGVGGVTVTVNLPPASGPNVSTPGAVEVIVGKSESLFFTQLFMSAASISARAVAVSGSGSAADDCVLALDSSPATSVSTAGVDITGNAIINLNNCGLQVNAAGADALDLSGSATLNAMTVSVGGNYSISGSAVMNVSGATTTSAQTLSDPYATLPVPSAGAAPSAPTGVCSGGAPASCSGSGSGALSPGTYTDGLTISGSGPITLSPGVYVMNGGGFNVTGSSTVTGSGVTIVLTGSGSNYATASIAGSATMNITAPTTGPTAGMAFFQDRNAPSSGSDSIAGSSAQSITGAIYFPNQLVTYSGSSNGSSPCTQLVAWRIKYSGSMTFNDSCVGTGVKPIGVTAAKLVE